MKTICLTTEDSNMDASNHRQMRDPSPIAAHRLPTTTTLSPFSRQRDPVIGDPKGDRNRDREARKIVRAKRALVKRDFNESDSERTEDDSEYEELARRRSDLGHNCTIWLMHEALKSKVLHQRAKEKMAVLDARHPDVFDIMKEVATSFQDKREYAEAEQIASQQLDLSVDLYGPKSYYTWECLRTVGDLRSKLGRHADAEQVFARSLEVADDGECMQL